MSTGDSTAPAPSRLLLPPLAIQCVREAGCTAWPNEGCGLLEGAISDCAVRVSRVLVCANVHEQPTHRYTIDPEEFLHAEHAAQTRDRTIVGVWHSHPNGEPVPSATDRAQAWPGWSYLIAGVTNGAMTALRCWQLGDDGFREQMVATVRESAPNPEIPDERA